MGIVIGMIIVLGLAGFFAYLTIKSEHSDLFKWVGIALFIAFGLTWVLPYGSMQEGVYYEVGMQRLGLADISSIFYYCIYFCLTTVLFFLAVGGFYGVVSKTESYKALVRKFGNSVNNKPLLTTTILSVLVIFLVSFTGNTYVWVLFLPFLASVLLYAKLDKMTVFTTTYGSLLAGILAATYGTGSLESFNYYIGTEVTFGLKYRLILALIFTAVYVVFNALRLRKKLQKKLVAEKDVDEFEVGESKSKGSTKLAVILFVFLVLFVFLGVFGWSDFRVEIFDKFHTWLTELKVGKDFTIFSYIMGTSALPFGNMEVTSIMAVLLCVTVLVGIVNRMSLKEFMDNFGSGFVKMLKPVCLFILAYAAFVTVYITPIVPTMIGWLNGLTKSFNPYLTTLAGIISSFFHADLGYTGYVVSSVIETSYADYSTLVHTLYVSTYGLVQLVLPTSGLLLLGLSYLKLDYKAWFKYIWILALIVLFTILIFATIVRYVI